MRFFKSFRLLHRRINSDPLVPPRFVVQADSKHKKTVSVGNELLSDAFSPLRVVPGADVRPTSHHNMRIIDLEAENDHLRTENVALLRELSRVQSQLKIARADLFAELHKSVRRAKQDAEEIKRLQEGLSGYVNLELKRQFGESRPLVSDLDRTILGSVSEPTAPNVSHEAPIGPRTTADYISALQMTLKSRRRLRECRKSAKFWKTIAKKDVKNADLVTPSNSNISSIHESLSAERRKAVEALVSRRRCGLSSGQSDTEQLQMIRTHFQQTLPIVLDTIKESPQVDACASPLPSSQPVGYRYDPSLSPLASQSFRKELSVLSSASRFPKWPVLSKSGDKDLAPVNFDIVSNVAVTFRQTSAPAPRIESEVRANSGSKSSNGVFYGPLSDQAEFETVYEKASRQEDEETRRNSESLPSNPLSTNAISSGETGPHGATGDTLKSSSIDSGFHSQTHGLGSSLEDSDFAYRSTISPPSKGPQRHVDQAIQACRRDNSCESSAVSATTPKNRVDKAQTGKKSLKSRLPTPVFRSLTRLSTTKPNIGEVGLVPFDVRSAARASPGPARINKKSI